MHDIDDALEEVSSDELLARAKALRSAAYDGHDLSPRAEIVLFRVFCMLDALLRVPASPETRKAFREMSSLVAGAMWSATPELEAVTSLGIVQNRDGVGVPTPGHCLMCRLVGGGQVVQIQTIRDAFEGSDQWMRSCRGCGYFEGIQQALAMLLTAGKGGDANA